LEEIKKEISIFVHILFFKLYLPTTAGHNRFASNQLSCVFEKKKDLPAAHSTLKRELNTDPKLPNRLIKPETMEAHKDELIRDNGTTERCINVLAFSWRICQIGHNTWISKL
jgi:hypothetical protein